MKDEDTPNRLPSLGAKYSEFASVRIVGNLGRTLEGKRVESERVPTPIKVGDLLDLLMQRYGIELRRDSTLVLVNGVEANALDDLDTVVRSGDDVFLVPMFHGG